MQLVQSRRKTGIRLKRPFKIDTVLIATPIEDKEKWREQRKNLQGAMARFCRREGRAKSGRRNTTSERVVRVHVRKILLSSPLSSLRYAAPLRE